MCGFDSLPQHSRGLAQLARAFGLGPKGRKFKSSTPDFFMQKKIIWLYITVFVNILGFGMIFPLLPLFAETFKATAFDIGILAASFSFAQFLTSPIIGRFSDRFGRKPVLLASVIGSALAFIIIGFADNLATVYISRILHGISTAGIFPIAQAYVADITTKDERAIYIGKVSSMFALGFVFGPAIGGFLANFGFSFAFFAAAFVSFVNLILISAFLPESITKKAEKFILREGLMNIKAIYHGLRGDFGVLFFLLFSWAFYISNFQVAIPLFTAHNFSMGTLGNGLFFSVTGLTSVIAQWFVLPVMVKKIGDIKTILVGICLMIFGQILAPISLNPLFFYVLFIISVFGSGLKRPVVNAVLSKGTLEGQGTTMGLAFSFESLGRVVGPVIAGLTISHFGLSFPFWVTTGVLIFGLFIFWRVEMRRIR